MWTVFFLVILPLSVSLMGQLRCDWLCGHHRPLNEQWCGQAGGLMQFTWWRQSGCAEHYRPCVCVWLSLFMGNRGKAQPFEHHDALLALANTSRSMPHFGVNAHCRVLTHRVKYSGMTRCSQDEFLLSFAVPAKCFSHVGQWCDALVNISSNLQSKCNSHMEWFEHTSPVFFKSVFNLILIGEKCHDYTVLLQIQSYSMKL